MSKQDYFNFCDEYDQKRDADLNKKVDEIDQMLVSLPIKRSTKKSVLHYITFIIRSQQYDVFERTIYPTFNSFIDLINNHPIVLQILENQAEHYYLAQFFEIIKVAKQWPTSVQSSIFQYLANKAPDQIQKLLLIINLDFYSIKDDTNLTSSLEDIWMITRSVINRCNKSFDELADIFDQIRDMEPCALKLAWTHLMNTFTTATSQFEAACVLLKKVKLLKFDYQKYALEFMIK